MIRQPDWPARIIFVGGKKSAPNGEKFIGGRALGGLGGSNLHALFQICDALKSRRGRIAGCLRWSIYSGGVGGLRRCMCFYSYKTANKDQFPDSHCGPAK